MKYRATVLTPTLVGDGNRLSPIDYMVWRDQVNVLNQTRIFKMNAKGPRLDSYLAQLSRGTKLDFASWGGYAQNYAERRIPFEDAAYTPYWNSAAADLLGIPTFATDSTGPFLAGSALKGALRTGFVYAGMKPNAVKDLGARLTGERLPRRPAENLEQAVTGNGGTDKLRVFGIADAPYGSREAFQVYLLRVATLVSKGENRLALGWKQAGRGAVDGKRPEDSTPIFAEMARPGTTFEGVWRENAFLNGDAVRASLRWGAPVTRAKLFEAANAYAAKQLEMHAQYAKWSMLEGLGASVAELQARLEAVRAEGGCLLSVGWGAGFLSKSAGIGADEAEHRKVLAMLPFYQRAIQTGLPFPKTRKIVFLKNKPATVAGWVELAVE